jgi:uncharacterized membrane protein YhaH (DUF805 family)
MKAFARRFASFEGRMRRTEFWLWYVALFALAALGLAAVIFVRPIGDLMVYLMLALLVPYVAFGARRLHDIGWSTEWLLLHLIPFGVFVMLVVFALPGQVGPNRFGPDPRGRIAASSRE